MGITSGNVNKTWLNLGSGMGMGVNGIERQSRSSPWHGAATGYRTSCNFPIIVSVSVSVLVSSSVRAFVCLPFVIELL